MLTFNEATSTFLLYTHDTTTAEKAGLTLSTTIRGPAGEKVYFTADQSKQPTFNPYAALEFYNEADERARARLQPLIGDYQDSWSDGMDFGGSFPSPDGKDFMPYQLAGIDYALGRDHCIIGDEPGLGKTIQAIGLANAMDARRVLVVCPASIRLNWRREIHDWSTIPRGTLATYPVVRGSSGVSDGAHYVIVSYDLLRNAGIHAALRAIKWDLGIFDEGHYLKTPDAQRTRAVFSGGVVGSKFYDNGLSKNIGKMVAMTGTPLPNRPREAYTLSRGLNWESIDYMSWDVFTDRFNPSMMTQTGHNVEAKGRLPELNARLRCNLMVRRLKKDVLPQLPDKRYEMTYIEPDGAIRQVLAREALIDFDPKDLFSSDFTLDGTPISTLRREMGEAMVPRVLEYIRYLFDIVEHPKLIIYGHHRSVIAALMEGLQKYNPVVHQGGMSDKAKDDAKMAFIHMPTCRAFVAQLDTMEGVDGIQSVCDNGVFAEPAWTPGRNEQCVDRMHRIGQHQNVIAHFLLVEGSFNERVLNVVLSKAGDIHESLDRRLL